MASDVVVSFQVAGIARVQEAFRTIEQATLRAERATIRSSQTSTRSREREYAQLAKTSAKWSRDAVKETERAERDKAKAVERSAKERVGIMLKADKMQAQAQKDAAREFDRIEQEKNRSSARWVKKRERDELESARRVMRARENFARVTVGAAGRGLNAGMRSATQATMGVAGSMLSLGGGFSISDSVHRATAASGMAADISNSGFLPKGLNEANKKRRSTSEIQSVTRGAATEYGLSNEDALSGLQKFTGLSGNLDAGMKMLPQLAQIARATGTSLDDLAEAAGNVSLNLPDDTDGEQTLHVIRKLAEGGKLGAVEMRDFAAQMAKVSASAAKFSGNRVENIIKMGALAQEARGEGGAFSASVAANSVSGFTTTLATSARVAAFQSHGINVFADKDKTKFKAPEEIIIEALKATKGNKLQMGGMFMGIMGKRAVEGFANRYTEAEAKAPGSGEAAVRGRMDELIGKTSPEELKKQFANDAAVRMQESDAKMAVVMAEFDKAVGEKIVPKLMELMPVLEKLIPQFVDMAAHGIPQFVKFIKSVGDFADANKATINSIAEHPIGALIGFEMAKAIGGAGLGVVMEKALATKLGAAGGLTIGTAMMAVQLGMIAIDKMGEDEANKNRGQVNLRQGAQGTQAALLGGIRNGTLTPDQIEAAKRTQAELSGEVDAAKGGLGKGTTGFFNTTFGALTKAGDWISGGVDAASAATGLTKRGSLTTNNAAEADQAAHDAQRARYEAAAAALEELTKVIKESEAALATHAETTTSVTKPNRDKSHADRN